MRSFPRLGTLSLSGCRLSEEVFRSLGDLPALDRLSLEGAMSSAVFYDWRRLARLREVDLHNMPLYKGEVGPLEFVRSLPNLQTLDLAGCDLSRIVLSPLNHARSIRGLKLERTECTDSMLEELTVLGQLEMLDLSGNKLLTKQGLSRIREANRLRDLRIADMSSDGDEVLRSIQGLRALQSLDLSNTPVTDKGILALRGLISLRALRLDSGQLSDQSARLSAPFPALRISCCATPTSPKRESVP